ncbi:MAG: hypothetical protein ABI870_01105 [Rhodanobacter sp.]
MKTAFWVVLFGMALGIAGTGNAVAQPLQDAAAGGDSMSQKATRPAPDPQRQAARLARKLQLSADQRAKIEPILQDRAQQLEQLRADSSLSERDRHRRQRELMQDSNTRLLDVLNDTQKQQFQQMMQEMKQRHQGMKSAPAEGGSTE